jgi:hypothetical protein
MQEYPIESEMGDARKWNETELKKMLSDQAKQSQIMKLECGRCMLTEYSHVRSVPMKDITNDISK